MENKDLLIKALRNALIQIKIYEMHIANVSDKEILKFSEQNIISISDVKDKSEIIKIMDIIENVGVDIFDRFDTDEIATYFGKDPRSFNKEMVDFTDDGKEVTEVLDEDPFYSRLMYHTFLEMIQEGDFSDRIPKELVDRSLEFFSSQEEFGTCKIIKDFYDNHKRFIVDSMCPQEFEQWQRKYIWKFHA